MSAIDRIIASIEAYRTRERITFADIAARAGVTEKTAHAVLRHGRGRVETLRRLERLLPSDSCTADSAAHPGQRPPPHTGAAA